MLYSLRKLTIFGLVILLIGSIFGASKSFAQQATATACTDLPPGSAAQLVSATPAGETQVTLTWTPAVDPVSSYLISYGTTPGNYTYGSVYLGGHDTKTYTVSNLAPNATYFFVVQAGNGCTQGTKSNELSTTIGSSTSLTPITPVQVLSPSTAAVITPADTPTPTPIPYQNYPQASQVTPTSTQNTETKLITQKPATVDGLAVFRGFLIFLAIVSLLGAIGIGAYTIVLKKKIKTPLEELKAEEAKKKS